MASAQNQQEMFGSDHDHDPCAHQAVGGGMIFSDLSSLFGLNKVNLVGGHSFAN